jgi:pseudaminic acid synthase
VGFRINNHGIGSEFPPFVIAEMSGNHNQSLEKALEIVRAAKRSGASAIKLQTYLPGTLTIDVEKEDFLVSDLNSLWKGEYLFSLYGKAFTPWEWHEPIFNEAKKLGLIYFSSAFDETSVEFLETLHVPIYKVASFENSHLPLIRKIANTGKPMIISTGMATLDEIEETVETARESGCKNLVLLKCTSNYPASPDSANLATIADLKKKFRCEVGLSDHTLGIGVSVAAVTLGASVIEKHITLTDNDRGVDSEFSMSENEMKRLVDECSRAVRAVGEISYGPTEEELPSIKFRRSIYAIDDINIGDELTSNNIGIIRPGYGLHPRKYSELLGKISRYRVQKGDRIDERFLSSN